MDAWVWILIVVVVLVILWFVWRQRQKQSSEQLREQFGPEYERAVRTKGGQSGAESELRQRAKRHEKLDIRSLSPAAREGYERSWQETQAKFVDEPVEALGDADRLVQEVMKERGYPVDDFEQRSADLSVDHPNVVSNYRSAHSTATKATSGDATTEEMRRAMQQYRSLFDELLERIDTGDESVSDQQDPRESSGEQRS